MTKLELVARLASHFPALTATDTRLATDTILDALTQELAAGGRSEIRGFGSFSLNSRPPRIGRNPKTGEKVFISAKQTPHFRAGKELRMRVDDKQTLP